MVLPDSRSASSGKGTRVITAIASVGAILSLLEVPAAILSERYGLGRKTAALATVAAIALLGVKTPVMLLARTAATATGNISAPRSTR